MRFYLDQTLGKLSKWLRLLGFDVTQIKLLPHKLGTLPAPEKDAYIVTRQSSWPARSGRSDIITLSDDRPEVQLTELCRRLQISPESCESLQRCSICNLVLLALPAWEAQEHVPDYIAQKHQQFFQCPQCHRVFWEGSHQQRIRQRLQDIQHQIKAP